MINESDNAVEIARNLIIYKNQRKRKLFAVIFKAKTGNQDKKYFETVSILRELAFKHYNCQDFIAVTEGNQEIAISYWLSEQDIQSWYRNAQHAIAQQLGKEKWYNSYTVEVTEIKRQYSFN